VPGGRPLASRVARGEDFGGLWAGADHSQRVGITLTGIIRGVVGGPGAGTGFERAPIFTSRMNAGSGTDSGEERSKLGCPAVVPCEQPFVLRLGPVSLAWISTEEDAFIYYRYAWNWAHGRGLVFNAGDRVEGFSEPIWMAVLALLARLGLDLPMTAPALGIACGAATLAATYILARVVGLSLFGGIVAVGGLALSVPFIVWSRSGLETPSYSLAIVVACAGYLAAEYPVCDGLRPRRWWRWIGAGAPVLVCLGRPEGLLLMPAMAADRLTDRRDYAGAIRYALPTVVGYGGYLLWRFLTFHSLVPPAFTGP